MKLTKKLLTKLISEALGDHAGLCSEAHPTETHEEYAQRQKEQDKVDTSMAKIQIKEGSLPPAEIQDVITDMVEKWGSAKYADDGARADAYHKELASLLSRLTGKPESTD